ncbi:MULTISPECIES: hypothetical protein [unclassified Streptomyces]|uniref:hypothetical protein n=1 Tax=unclassified Streptomyces TaxID=2593676 RepID=UPI00382397F6
MFFLPVLEPSSFAWMWSLMVPGSYSAASDSATNDASGATTASMVPSWNRAADRHRRIRPSTTRGFTR